MPELPEVEAARRAIEEHCVGKKIRRSVVADDDKVISGVSPSDLESALAGKTIVAALRKGKSMWLRLDSPPFPSFQFGMAGAVYIKGAAVTNYKRSAVRDGDEWPSKFSKVFVELEDGLELSFTDKRRFARVRLLQDPEAVPPISELGPDTLLEPLQIDAFVDALSKKNTVIKALLLDQSFVSGIGNWIADEVLYQARIHPLQIASSLSREDCESLHRCIKEVIQYAVEVDAECSSFPIEWLFHYRWGKKSGKVNGKRVEFIAAGGRTSAIVPELQKLTGAKSGRSRKANPDDEDDDKGSEAEEIEKEKEIKRPRPKNRKNGKVTSQRQQKKADDSGDNSEEADEEERPKKKNGKKPLTADKMQRKVVMENKDELKPEEQRQVKETSKKRSQSKEASTHQKKKTRK